MVRRAADIVLLGAVRERVADKTDLQIVPSARQCNLTWCDVFLFYSFLHQASLHWFFFFFCANVEDTMKRHRGQSAKRERRHRKLISVKRPFTFSAPQWKLPRRRKVSEQEDLPTQHLKTRWRRIDHLSLSCRVRWCTMFTTTMFHQRTGGHERDGGKGGCKSFTSAFLLPFLNQSSALGSDHKDSQTSSKCWLRSPSHLNPNHNVSLNSDNLFPCVKCNLKQGRTKWYTFQTNC